MKKTSLLIVCFLVSLSSLWAQEKEESKKFEHQLAINATNFIQTLISFNGSTFNNTPYDFQYKFLTWNGEGKSALGLRSGFGYSHSFASSEFPSQKSKSKTDTELMNFRLGAEYQCYLSKSWTFFAGLDMLYGKTIQSNYSEFSSGFGGLNTQTTDDYRERFGVGPVCGIQFNMGKRLALGTELSLYAQSETQWRTSTFVPNSANNQFFKTKSGTTSIRVPSFVYFIIRI